MTAEIAILNRSAIAFAADSAVTIGRDRVWKNTNKLFHLSAAADVGVMIFGSGDFCGVPWDVLIKEYRRKIENATLPTLEAYKDSFIEFLDEFKMPNGEGQYVHRISFILEVVESLAQEIKATTRLARRTEFSAVIQDLSDDLNEIEELYTKTERFDFSAKEFDEVQSLLSEVVKAHVTKELCEEFLKLFCKLSSRQCESE